MRVTAGSPIGRIAQMGAAFAVSNLARSGIGFLTSLVIGRALGRDEFGVWTFCLAWASTLIAIFDLGFGLLLTREAAQAECEIGRLIGSAMAVRLTLFLPVGIVFYATTPWLAPGATAAGLRLAVFIAGAGIGYSCFSAPFRARPDWLVAILGLEAAGASLQLAASWWMVARGSGLMGLLTLAAAIQGVQFFAGFVMWRAVAGESSRIEFPSPRSAAAFARRGLPFMFSGLVANAQTRLAPLMLGYLATAGEVASFGAAWRIGNLVRTLPYAIFAGALPVFAREATSGRGAALRSRFDGALVGFALLAAGSVAAAAAPILKLTYGATFTSGATTLVWVAAGLVPSLLNSGRKVYLFALGQERVAVRWAAFALAAQVVGCAALIRPFGASGAAAALLVGEALAWWPLRSACLAPPRDADQEFAKVAGSMNVTNAVN